MLVTEQIPATSDIVRFRVDGKITAQQMDEFVEQVKAQAKQSGKLRLYGEYVDFDGWENLKAFFSSMHAKLASIGKVEKYALITDKKWLESLSEALGAFTFGMELKTFHFDEKQQALNWLQMPTADETLTLAEVDTGAKNLLGFTLNGNLGKADYEFLNSRMEAQLTQCNKLRLYFELLQFGGITLKAILEDFKTGIKYYNKIEKIALVTDSSWGKFTNIGDILTPGIEIKHFPFLEKQAAIEWLSKP